MLLEVPQLYEFGRCTEPRATTQLSSHGPCHLARITANGVLAATFICNAAIEYFFVLKTILTLRICTLAYTVKRNVQFGFI